jgi:hypothetical protein
MLRLATSVVDSHQFDADLDHACNFDADADSDPAVTLMQIRVRILSFSLTRIMHGPVPSFKIKAQTLKKWSNRLIFHTFWLVICKLMPILIRIRIQLSL